MSGVKNLANALANDPSFKTDGLMKKGEAGKFVPQHGHDAPPHPGGSGKGHPGVPPHGKSHGKAGYGTPHVNMPEHGKSHKGSGY